MASSEYFSNFPKITYGNTSIDNILLRVNFLDSAKNNTAVYYPYEVKDGEKAEQIAFGYYGDSNYVWIIYLFNNIIDPYYDWVLSSEDFENYLILKYGSIAEAQTTILYYEQGNSQYFVSYDGKSIIPFSEYDPRLNGYNYTLMESNNYNRVTPETYAINPQPDLYTPVYAYTDEVVQNENKRFIKLLNKTYLQSVVKQMSILLNE